MTRNENDIRKAAQDYIDVEVKPRDEEENRKCVECYSVGFWLAADMKDVDRDDDAKKLYLNELYQHYIFDNKEQSFVSMIEWLLNQLWIRDRRDFKLDLLGKEVAEESGTSDDE